MNHSLQQYFSSSDSENDLIYEYRRPRRFRERINFVSDRSSDTTERFRLTDDDINFLDERIGSVISHPTQRNRALSSEQQIRLSLRYLSTGSDFRVIGDAHGVHKSAVSRAFHRVVDAVNDVLYDEFVSFPANSHGDAARFRGIAGMPCIFGCIDGSHIPIVTPEENENQFINRHGYHSINGLFVCGADMSFYYCALCVWCYLQKHTEDDQMFVLPGSFML